MADFHLTKMAVDMYCPGNVVQKDDEGLPSLLVWIPAFKNSDVLAGGDDNIHPAFIVNGKQIPGFYYSKYQNVVHNGKAYSLPAEGPAVNMTFDTAREYCEAKGYGWHLSTAAEWAAIALWCKKNGTMPKGNNKFGRDAGESENKAIPYNPNSEGTIFRVATGTGPLTWSHDGTASGIWDMNGNLWEWQGGLRMVWGEIQILANNDAADPDNPLNTTSTCWKAINATDGSLVEPESKTTDAAPKTSGQTVKLNNADAKWIYSTGVTYSSTQPMGCRFGEVTCDTSVGDAAKILLRALALLPDIEVTGTTYGFDYMWANNGASERVVYRGGAMNSGSDGGVFALYNTKREVASQTTGFRAAYIPNI